jgi:hypothetical protein
MTINNYCVTLIRFKKLHLVNMEHILVNTQSKTVTVNTILTQTKILTINKYQTIVVNTELSHLSPEMSSTEYRDVQFSTEMSRYRDV